MRSDVRWVVALAACAVVACGGSSKDSLFTGGTSTTGSGGAAAGTGGSSMSGAGGQTSGDGGNTSVGGAGFGGFDFGGAINAGGAQNAGGFGNGGTLVDAGAGGVIGFGGDGSGGFGFGGEGTGGAGGPDGVSCGTSQCTADQQCCVTGNTRTCEAGGGSCCTGLACTSTPVTCDSQSDCTGGEVCCANVTVGFASRVTSIKCQATCGSALTQYVLCDPNGPDICTGNTKCSQGLLITSYYFCQ